MKDKKRLPEMGSDDLLTVCAILVFYDTFYMSGALQRLLSKLRPFCRRCWWAW